MEKRDSFFFLVFFLENKVRNGTYDANSIKETKGW